MDDSLVSLSLRAIERYYLYESRFYGAEMEPSQEGDWVKYEDVVKLVKKS